MPDCVFDTLFFFVYLLFDKGRLKRHMSFVYKCLLYDGDNTDPFNCVAVCHSTDYFLAIKRARKEVSYFIWQPFNIIVTRYIEIYKVPAGEVVLFEDKDHYYLETVFDTFTKNILKIQRWWRRIRSKRKRARKIIGERIWFALGNPYTQLGRNRLLREFNEL